MFDQSHNVIKYLVREKKYKYNKIYGMFNSGKVFYFFKNLK